jgi:hypothetical protein
VTFLSEGSAEQHALVEELLPEHGTKCYECVHGDRAEEIHEEPTKGRCAWVKRPQTHGRC